MKNDRLKRKFWDFEAQIERIRHKLLILSPTSHPDFEVVEMHVVLGVCSVKQIERVVENIVPSKYANAFIVALKIVFFYFG